MPVTNTPSKIIYTGNGATSFPIPFPFFDPAHIRVVLTENDNDTELTSNFKVERSDSAANLIYPLDGPPLGSNQRLTIYRWVPVEQLVELTNQGGYYPEVVEKALDLGAMIDQQQQEEASRTIKLPVSYDGDANDSNLALVLLDAKSKAVDAAGRAEGAAAISEGAAARAERHTTQLMGLSIAIDDAPHGEAASGSYNPATGMLTLRVPEGERGQEGPSGPAGPAGRDGVDGKDGRDGVDGSPGLAPIIDVIDCGGAAATHVSIIDGGFADSF